MAVLGSFVATAYGPPWGGIEGTGVTATGIKLPGGVTNRPGPYVVAVDPSVIPLGSLLKINPNPFGNPNIVFSAQDTGGAIKGNRIDFFDPLGQTHMNDWGRRPVSVQVLGRGKSGALPPASATTGSVAGLGGVSSSSSGAGGSEWLKLLLDVVFLGFGAAFVYRGGKRMLQQQGSG